MSRYAFEDAVEPVTKSVASADEGLSTADTIFKAAALTPIFAAPALGYKLGKDLRNGDDLGEIYGTARRAQETNANTNAKLASADDVISERIAEVKAKTGIDLDHPNQTFRGRWVDEGMQRFRAEKGRFPNSAQDREDFRSFKVAAWQDEVNRIEAEHGKMPGFAAPIEDAAKVKANLNQQDADAAYGEAKGSVGPFLASMGGALVGTFRDPISVMGLAATGGRVKAASFVGQVAENAARQALVNASISAVSQPDIQAWKAERGQENGVGPAMKEIGLAALVGAGFGAGGELIKRGWRNLRGVSDGQLRDTIKAASEGDLKAASQLAEHLPQEQARELKAALASEKADDAALPKPPPGVTADDNLHAFRQSLRHAESPNLEPPPEMPVVAPPADAQASLFASADAPTVKGESFNYRGRPITFGTFRPDEIKTDAKMFQYKGGGDAAGVTDRLKSVAQWDQVASGKTMLWQREDGQLFIADGHQRHGLATRLAKDDPNAQVQVDGYVFRQADGWTPDDVRAYAAKKNIQEGSGDALDTARVLRERPDIWDATLPVSDNKLKQAQGLARLHDSAWEMTLNELVPPHYAAAVGRMVENPSLHVPVMEDLIKFKPVNEHEARLVIGEALAAGFAHETQVSLFGTSETTRSLMGQRVKVMASAAKLLSDDAKVFGLLVREADRIAAAGNVLVDKNASKAEQAAQLAQIVETLSRRTGPVSDALNRAARELSENPRALAKASRTFVDDVAKMIEKDGLHGLDRPSAMERPAQVIETPHGPEAAKQIEALTERTPAGEQQLMPGVTPVTDRQRMELQASKPMAGGDNPPPSGGLFDDGARSQKDLLDLVPAVKEDGNAGLLKREAADQIGERQNWHADITDACKG